MPTLIVLFDRKPGRPSGAPSPRACEDVVDVRDLVPCQAGVAPETLRRVAAQFREFADGPTLILTERI